MAKQRTKKKRSKQYHGENAALKGPRVHRVSVEERSKLKEYFEDNKIKVYTRIVQLAFLGVVAIILYWVFF